MCCRRNRPGSFRFNADTRSRAEFPPVKQETGEPILLDQKTISLANAPANYSISDMPAITRSVSLSLNCDV